MKLGFGELLIIFVVILFIVGPDKIPSFAKKLGEGLKAFKSATSDVTKELKENVMDPLNEASVPIREAMEPLTEMKNEIDKSVTDFKRDVTSLNNVTKTPVKNTAQVTESEPEGEGTQEQPAPKPLMKTAHISDSDLEEDYSPLVPRHSAKPKANAAPKAAEPEPSAEPTAPAEPAAAAEPEAPAPEQK